MMPQVRQRLLARGIDPSGHVQRRLSRQLVDAANLLLCMGLGHQQFVRERFGVEVPLYNEVVHGVAEPVLDVNEAVPDYRTNPDAAFAHALDIVDRLCEEAPRLLARLDDPPADATWAWRA